ncbi:MAG: hypothetical protein ABIS01_02385 [Ferruginibacter sp.]
METKIDILNELASLSPVVAAIKKVNIFTIPEGYFESVPQNILICLQEQYSLLIEQVTKHPADVPEGYFNNLAGAILDKIKAGETAEAEIRTLSPLLYSLQNKNVFAVPYGYFESVQTYLFDRITNHIQREELKEISPLLYLIKDKQVFAVAEDYFTNLPGDILKKVQIPTGRIVSMPGRRLLKYAVAAMLTAALSLGLYKYFNNAPISANDNIVIASLDASVEKGKNMNDKQFNESIQNLTETDIAKYLEKNGDITDVAVLSNNVEDISLPSEDDYLLDEATLDNYLKEIEKPTPNN